MYICADPAGGGAVAAPDDEPGADTDREERPLCAVPRSIHTVS